MISRAGSYRRYRNLGEAQEDATGSHRITDGDYFRHGRCADGPDTRGTEGTGHHSPTGRRHSAGTSGHSSVAGSASQNSCPSATSGVPVYPTTGRLKLDGEPARGSSSAPLTLVEFTDYECPFCRQFETTTLPEILKRYVDTGKVRLVIHDFPLNIHANAMPAAEAAHCAGDQGKFWLMHDALFSEPAKMGLADLIDHAGALKLDIGIFKTCLESGKDRADITKQMKTASDLRIMATPSFLIGRTVGDVVDGSIITGAQPLSVFEAKLKEAEGAK